MVKRRLAAVLGRYNHSQDTGVRWNGLRRKRSKKPAAMTPCLPKNLRKAKTNCLGTEGDEERMGSAAFAGVLLAEQE